MTPEQALRQAIEEAHAANNRGEEWYACADWIEQRVKELSTPSKPADAGQAAGLLPCPFCGIALQFDGEYWFHKHDDCCVFSDWCIQNAARWNRRATPPVAAQEVTDALRNLVAKLDQICASDEYLSVFTFAHIHSCPYTGENFELELDAAKAALARTPWDNKEGAG